MKRRSPALWTTTLQVVVPGLPPALSGARIAFLSDLHEGMLYVSREQLLDALNQAEPELVLLGGDYLAGRRSAAAAIELVQLLGARHRLLGVLGNADCYYDLNLDALRSVFADSGGRLLVNEGVSVSLAGGRIDVVGLDDPTNGQPDAAAATLGLNETSTVRFALVHSPAAWRMLGEVNAHLMLCGHSHGGQVRPPGLEAPVTHGSYPAWLAAGLFRYRTRPSPHLDRLLSHWRILGRRGRPIRALTEPGPLLYVSRGIGCALAEVRILCPPELVLIELEAAETDVTEDRAQEDRVGGRNEPS